MATTKQFDIKGHPTMKQSGFRSITGIYPFSSVGISLVLAFLIAVIVATKLVNGYLICNLTLTTFYQDLAIGVALIIACGIIPPLLALAIDRNAKTREASRCSTFVIVLVFALLVGILVSSLVAAVLNFIVAVPTNWSPFGIDLQRESQVEALQLQQLPSEDAADRIFAYCSSNNTDGNPDLLALATFGRYNESNPNRFGIQRIDEIFVPPERCEEAHWLRWTTRRFDLCRQDPFNVCSANDNDAIKAFFRSDPATFRIVQRIDVIFKTLAGLLWFLPAVWTVVVIFALICEIDRRSSAAQMKQWMIRAGATEEQINVAMRRHLERY